MTIVFQYQSKIASRGANTVLDWTRIGAFDASYSFFMHDIILYKVWGIWYITTLYVTCYHVILFGVDFTTSYVEIWPFFIVDKINSVFRYALSVWMLNSVICLGAHFIEDRKSNTLWGCNSAEINLNFIPKFELLGVRWRVKMLDVWSLLLFYCFII